MNIWKVDLEFETECWVSHACEMKMRVKMTRRDILGEERESFYIPLGLSRGSCFGAAFPINS